MLICSDHLCFTQSKGPSCLLLPFSPNCQIFGRTAEGLGGIPHSLHERPSCLRVMVRSCQRMAAAGPQSARHGFGHLVRRDAGRKCHGPWTSQVFPSLIFLQDLLAMTRLIAEFIGVNLSEELIRKIVDHCSFNQMKDNPSVNRTEIPLKDLFSNTQKKFMRKGVIGDWKNHFTPEQSAAFDKCYQDKMKHVQLTIAFDREQAEDIMSRSSDNRIISRHSSVERLVTTRLQSIPAPEEASEEAAPESQTNSEDNNNQSEAEEIAKKSQVPFERMFPVPLNQETSC